LNLQRREGDLAGRPNVMLREATDWLPRNAVALVPAIYRLAVGGWIELPGNAGRI